MSSSPRCSIDLTGISQPFHVTNCIPAWLLIEILWLRFCIKLPQAMYYFYSRRLMGTTDLFTVLNHHNQLIKKSHSKDSFTDSFSSLLLFCSWMSRARGSPSLCNVFIWWCVRRQSYTGSLTQGGQICSWGAHVHSEDSWISTDCLQMTRKKNLDHAPVPLYTWQICYIHVIW